MRRDGLSGERDGSSLDRDESAVQRDASSTMRDRVADELDEEAARLDAKDDVADQHTLGVADLRGRSRSGRTRAAVDRDRARHDREHSGGDRHHAQDDRSESRGDRLHAMHDREHAGKDRGDAELDRVHARLDRHAAGIDELTGAKRRGVGLEGLGDEMARARRESNGRFVAAYVDVDGLKSVNDEHGHEAGDTLLRAVAAGFRHHLRPYDLLVRMGGDEFLLALPNVTLTEAQERFDAVRAELEAAGGGSVSIGYAGMRDGDSPADLVKRADTALLASRR